MQIQSQSTRDAIAVKPIPFSGSFELQIEARHLGRDGVAPKAARQTLRSPQLSLAEQLALTYRTRDDRLAVIAHELLNSLSVVRNGARLFGAQQTVPGIVETARLLIERTGHQMSRLIEDSSTVHGQPGRILAASTNRFARSRNAGDRGIELDFRRRGHRAHS